MPFQRWVHTSARCTLALLAPIPAPAQSIVAQPPPQVFATAGTPATWSVGATGGGLTFQWRKQGLPLPGATAADFRLAAANPGDAGLYDVVITAGGISITSRATQLDVRPPTSPTTVVPRPNFWPLIEGPVGGIGGVIPDGDGLIAFGDFSSVDSLRRVGLVRFNAAGGVDPAFVPAGSFDWVGSVLRLPDGRLIVTGSSEPTRSNPGLIRLNPDGSRDESFVAANPGAEALAMQPDGRLLIASVLRSRDGSFFAARLNAEGAADASFLRTTLNNRAYALAVQPDGRILVGGDFTQVNQVARGPLVRLLPDGTLDGTFSIGASLGRLPPDFESSPARVRKIVVQPDGKIIALGQFAVTGTSRVCLARFNPDGSLDPGFVADPGTYVTNAAVLGDGRLLVTQSEFSEGAGRLVRLNPNGSVDPGFTPGLDARGRPKVLTAVAPLADGHIAVIEEGVPGLQWLKGDGSIDAAFRVPEARRAPAVHAIVPAAGGQWLIGGSFQKVGGQSRRGIARLHRDGSLDAAFNPGTGAARPPPNDELGAIHRLTVQADGKIVATGRFTSFNGITRYNLVRLLPDGAVDPALDLGSLFLPEVETPTIFVQQRADGKLLIAGRSTLRVVNADGSFSTEFTAAVNRTVSSFALQPDGKMLLAASAGAFGVFLRLNPDGTQDTGFRGALDLVDDDPFFIIRALALQPDGKILVAGLGRRSALIRLLPDGKVDPTFAIGVTQGSPPTAMALESSGRILVGGAFTAYNGVPQNGFVRLNPDGSLDPSLVWRADVAGAAPPAGIAFDADGIIVVTGNPADTSGRVGLGLVKLESPVGRLSNCSVRTGAGSGDNPLVVGFVIAGRGSKPILLRAIGPSLLPFGVANVLADPQLRLFDAAGGPIAFNDDWAGDAATVGAMQRVGAFPLASGSKDAVLLVSLGGAGAYSAHVGTASGTGVALLEAYDADPPGAATRFSNLSARSQVGTGANVLVVGFVVDGNAPRTVLIRAIGPALVQFGVTGALVNPQLRVFNHHSHLIHANDDWGGAAALATVFRQTGAFELPADSRDAAIVVTLAPGAYSAQVSGVNESTGAGLVEVYDLP